MNERNRYRVTGSIFLIALAVILLPMLFDGVGAPMQESPPMPPPQALAEPLPNFAELVPATDVVERVEALREEIDEQGFATAAFVLASRYCCPPMMIRRFGQCRRPVSPA